LFATGVVDTGGKFAASVVDTDGNYPPVSTTPAELVAKFAAGTLVLFQGLGERRFTKQNLKQKSRDTVPLKLSLRSVNRRAGGDSQNKAILGRTASHLYKKQNY
jgi:hypothetical protein